MKRVLLTAVALLFGAAAFAQPSASVETLARKYADRDGALVKRLDSTMVGLVKLRVAALPDSLRRSAALLDKVSGMTNIMLMTGLRALSIPPPIRRLSCGWKAISAPTWPH